MVRENAINVLDWPACSLDLNLIENLWGIIYRKVYAEGKHFGSISDLEFAIIQAWNEIPESTPRTLSNSMAGRFGQVILKRGCHLDN